MDERAAPLELIAGTVRYGAHDVLRSVDFALRPNEFVILLGPNGSGKTTLVKALLGLVRLAEGSRRLFGQPPEEFRDRKSLGYVPQRVSAATGIPATIEEVVSSGRTAHLGLLGRFGKQDRAAVQRALELVDLATVKDARVERLSGGQQQRVLIARALAAEPRVLVMDEPVASVDLAHQESFAATLERLHGSGTSILMVAHSLGALEPLAQRAVVLERGIVVYDGAPSQAVLGSHVHPHHPGNESKRS